MPQGEIIELQPFLEAEMAKEDRALECIEDFLLEADKLVLHEQAERTLSRIAARGQIPGDFLRNYGFDESDPIASLLKVAERYATLRHSSRSGAFLSPAVNFNTYTAHRKFLALNGVDFNTKYPGHVFQLLRDEQGMEWDDLSASCICDALVSSQNDFGVYTPQEFVQKNIFLTNAISKYPYRRFFAYKFWDKDEMCSKRICFCPENAFGLFAWMFGRYRES